MRWDALAARARGLAGHLLPAEECAALAATRDLAELAAHLVAAGYPIPGGPVSARAIERAVRQRIAADLRILARWAGGAGGGLGPVFLDEDRRSLRAILRGIAAGAPLADRVASLAATPELPAARLDELARQASAAEVAELLIRWRSPFGWAVGPEASRSRPDLFSLERAIDRCFASRAVALAPRGGRPVERFVAHLVDQENAFAALALARAPDRSVVERMFIAGGERLGVARFLAAIAAGPDGAASALAGAFPTSQLARALGAGGDVEDAALADLEREQVQLARALPASAATVLAFVLRRHAEARAIRRAIWQGGHGREVAA